MAKAIKRDRCGKYFDKHDGRHVMHEIAEQSSERGKCRW